MATLTFSFSTGNSPLSRITDAFRAEYLPLSGETNAQLTQRVIREQIIAVVKRYERKQAEAQIVPTPFDLT